MVCENTLGGPNNYLQYEFKDGSKWGCGNFRQGKGSRIGKKDAEEYQNPQANRTCYQRGARGHRGKLVTQGVVLSFGQGQSGSEGTKRGIGNIVKVMHQGQEVDGAPGEYSMVEKESTHRIRAVVPLDSGLY